MNARQLAKLGIPQDCVPQALQVVQVVAKHNRSVPKDQRIDVEQAIHDCVEQPESYRQADQTAAVAEHAAALRQLPDTRQSDTSVSERRYR